MASQESALPSGPLPQQDGRHRCHEERLPFVADGIKRFAS